MNRFVSSGDLGDIIASLPAVRHLGGGVYHLVNRPWTKALLPRVHLIEPLLRSQPYITDVVAGELPAKKKCDTVFDFSTFRQGGLPWGKTLGALQAEWVGVPAGEIDFTQPWLVGIPPSRKAKGRFVVARSPRYHTPTFPWRAVLGAIGEGTIFLGLPEECEQLQSATGASLQHVPTRDLLEVAQIIAGSHCFIGNQSSPFNIAEGLKHPRILECCDWVPDCCYGGGDFQYVPDGEVRLPLADGRSVHIPPYVPPPDINPSITPPGGWQYTMPGGAVLTSVSFEAAKFLIRQAYQQTNLETHAPSDIGAALIEQTICRLPDYAIPRWFVGRQAIYQQIKKLTDSHVLPVH